MRVRAFSHILGPMTDIILPPQPLVVGAIDSPWGNLAFLDEPCCASCGFPFEFDVGLMSHCGDCSAKPPLYDRARSAFVYDEASRRLVLSFKHGGRTEALRFFSAQMKRAGRRFWNDADFLVPVPLHPSRLIKRRFNQSALLGRRLCKSVPASFEPDILFRHRATVSQGSQTAAGRIRNVQGAFRVPDKMKDKLQGKHVVLIDDVMTTGATLNACARTLKRAGASYIDVVTLARTVRYVSGSYGETHAQS